MLLCSVFFVIHPRFLFAFGLKIFVSLCVHCRTRPVGNTIRRAIRMLVQSTKRACIRQWIVSNSRELVYSFWLKTPLLPIEKARSLLLPLFLDWRSLFFSTIRRPFYNPSLSYKCRPNDRKCRPNALCWDRF